MSKISIASRAKQVTSKLSLFGGGKGLEAVRDIIISGKAQIIHEYGRACQVLVDDFSLLAMLAAKAVDKKLPKPKPYKNTKAVRCDLAWLNGYNSDPGVGGPEMGLSEVAIAIKNAGHECYKEDVSEIAEKCNRLAGHFAAIVKAA